MAWWAERGRGAAWCTGAAFFCAAVALTVDERAAALHPRLGPHRDPIGVRALLIEDAAPLAGFTLLEARVKAIHTSDGWQPADGGVTLTVGGAANPGAAAEWKAGRVIQTFATFRRPARYLDDGVPDFERDLALAGVAFFGSIKSGLLVDVHLHGTWVQELAAEVRAHVRRSVQRWVAPHDVVSAAIVTAVVIGDRTGLPADVRSRLQAAGTYHVIAISGGNIAILGGLIFGMVAACGAGGRAAACLTLMALIAYAQVVTAGASVWRATLMASIYLSARLLDQRSPPWHALAAAAAIVVCVRPLDVRDVGFMLTFGATAALLEAARRVMPLLSRGRVLSWLLASIAASLAAEIALLPINAWTFSRVTSAGLLLNLAAVPLMALVQVGGIAVACFSAIDPIARAAGWVSYAAAAALTGSARLMDVAPWLATRVPPPSLLLMAAYYCGLITALLSSGICRRVGVAIVAASALAIVTGRPAGWLGESAAPDRLRLTMFDVGQGEATLVELPDRSRVLVDAGGMPFGSGAFDIGSRVLAPALWARGVRRLEALLITHGDPDHIGGASAVVDDFGPARLWEGVPVLRHGPLQELLRQAEASGVRVQQLEAGDAWEAGGARVRVLHPPAPDWERQRVRNDDSVVLEMVFGQVAVLLLGDAGADVERAILPLLTPARHRVLKVGHHGSRTSTSPELLDHWRPGIALISCGRGNTFGHPAPEVLRRLASSGARVYRTDLDGQITLETDGRAVSVRTFEGR